ncbi:MAG: hypothetical protein R2695_11300 [Acidimicrobiales bacterium]
MIRVKEDYFKGGDSFLKSPELPELLEHMDANGVEKAILRPASPAGNGPEFAEAEPDRFRSASAGSTSSAR